MVEVELSSVRVDLRSNTPLILLREKLEPHRSLPIFIGAPEATSIAMAQRGYEAPRPLTHDLTSSIISRMGGVLEKVVVVELRDSTYYADLYIIVKDQTIVVSARPSDAVALAIRVGSMIFVNDDLIAREGVVVSDDDVFENNMSSAEEDPNVINEFREFLDNITPEDFSE